MENTEQPLLIPVGHEVTVEEMRGYSIETLQRRNLFDPRYAGFEPHFDWHKYVKLEDMDDAGLKRSIEATLDQFATTEEGQHMLRQAFAMQAYRDMGDEQRVRVLQGFGLDFGGGLLSLSRAELEKFGYKSQDGICHPTSLQQVLFHELCHAMDALNTDESQAAIQKVFGEGINRQIEQQITQILGPNWKSLRPGQQLLQPTAEQDRVISDLAERYQSIMEYPAIATTNPFMKSHYGELERILDHRIECMPAGSLASLQQPRTIAEIQVVSDAPLGADHFHEQINAPSTPRLPEAKQR